MAALLAASTARAYDAPTHAGLTERAAFASSLHRRLVERLGRPLGLYEPLGLGPERDDQLRQRLQMLDPEGGYAPDGGAGSQGALAWLTAGAVLEDVPAARGRHHFFDPSDGSGLDQPGGTRTRLASVAQGVGTLRGVLTGTAFDGTGSAATRWLTAPRAENEWGLARFLDERELAASAPTQRERDGALARALLAAGAILHLVEDAGDPAHVRNDYRVALEADARAYQRLVASRYGRLAVPEPAGAPVVRTHLVELFHDASGEGLADRTQARFFSNGTLPGSGRYARPVATAGPAPSGYARSDEVAHLAAWQRSGGDVRWFLDNRCASDYAAVLLPEIGRYAVGALELLFRGRLELTSADGALHVTARELDLGAGTLTIYADDANGRRRSVGRQAVTAAFDGQELAALPRPDGVRVAAVFRGVDRAGEPIVIVEEQSLGAVR
jgi:hypothetical protein